MADTTQAGSVPLTSAGQAAGPRAASASVARQYAVISLFVVPALVGLSAVALGQPAPVADARVLLGPVFVLLGITAVVWTMLFLVRNASVVAGIVPVDYFRYFTGTEVPDWVERPARTFNNLMQLPNLFYGVCALMMASGAVDSVQVSLAWIFAASRLVHAVVFVLWNDVKWRFATAVIGFIAMGVIAYRFAAQTASFWL